MKNRGKEGNRKRKIEEEKKIEEGKGRKTSYLNEEVNCPDPFHLVSFPCLNVLLNLPHTFPIFTHRLQQGSLTEG